MLPEVAKLTGREAQRVNEGEPVHGWVFVLACGGRWMGLGYGWIVCVFEWAASACLLIGVYKHAESTKGVLVG